VGQRLVPADSEKLFAFKVTKDPVPYAYTLSTGTVYISTGLISLTDNEAQLAYILSHELAHVYKDHWKTKVMGAEAQDEYNKKQVKKRALWGGIIGAGLGAAIGGAAGRSAQAAATGAMVGGMGGLLVGVVTSRKLGVDWEYAQENEADEFGLKNTLDKNYDIQEVPKFYLALKQSSAVDQRVGLGFIAQSKRVKDRMEYANKEIQGTLQADYQAKLKAGQLVGTSPDYQLMMAELKRDNGVIAFAYDMFGMARQNLRQAVNLRSDDARARFYYAKVMKLTARNDVEKTLARGELLTAIKLDEDRHAIPEAELQRAVMLMDNPDSSSQAEATQALKNYIVSYQESQVQGWKYSSSLPPNMDILDDYLRLLGEPKWKPPFPELYRVLAPDVVAARTTLGLVPASVPGTSQGTASTSVVPAKAESQPK
jgi:predicted Zn-dependent protease